MTFENALARVNQSILARRFNDDTEPEPTDVCNICHGLQFLRRELPVNHPEFGKVFPCFCVQDQVATTGSGILVDDLNRFIWPNVQDINGAFRVRDKIFEILERGHGWIFLFGNPGTGKTTLLKTTITELVKAGIPAKYTNMSSIIDDLRASFDHSQPSQEILFRLHKWQNADILAIDEFDRVNMTEFAQDRQFRLMDERYQSALNQKTVTIMASNMPPTSFGDYLSDRILDRQFVVVDMGETSARQLELNP